MTQEKQDLFGSTFQFLCVEDDTVFTYHAGTGAYPLITWKSCEGLHSSFDFTQEQSRLYVAEGSWAVLPSKPKQPSRTPKQFDKEAFSSAEKAVKEALFPVVDPSLQEVLSEFHHKFGGQLDCMWHGGATTYCTLKFGMFGEETLKKVLIAINGVKFD